MLIFAHLTINTITAQSHIHILNSNDIITTQVLERLRSGDHDAYKEVFVHYKMALENFLSKLLGSAEEGRKTTQDVFVALWTKREMIIPEKGIKPLLFTMAKNAAFNHIRRKKTTGGIMEKQTQYLDADSGVSSDDDMTAENTRLLTEIAVERMPEKRKKIYQMLLEDIRPEEIALRMHITIDNVYNHISRARKAIQDILTKAISR